MMKINRTFLFNNIYLIIVLYFFYSCFNGINFFGLETTYNMEKYFGIGKYLVFIILFANYFVEFFKEKKTKNRYLLLSYFLYLFYISFIILILSFELGILFNRAENFNAEVLDMKLASLAYFKYNFGLVPGYIARYIVINENAKIFYAGISISVLATIFMIIIFVNYILIRVYRIISKGYKKRKYFEEKEEDLENKIEIKEISERKAVQQSLRRKRLEEEEQEEKIRNKVSQYKNKEK
ncbi:MAG: hypothetical protein ACRCSK_01220 [Fusobacteriaceae bacterium]